MDKRNIKRLIGVCLAATMLGGCGRFDRDNGQASSESNTEIERVTDLTEHSEQLNSGEGLIK